MQFFEIFAIFRANFLENRIFAGPLVAQPCSIDRELSLKRPGSKLQVTKSENINQEKVKI